MRAIVSTEYGEADVLRLAEVPMPTAGSGEVLVRVRAAGVDRGVWHVMAGRPLLVRAALGRTAPRLALRGREFAGIVEAVGPGVTRLRPGDEVFGTTSTGCFADYAVAPQTLLAVRPATVSFEQAAVTPVSGGSALQAVRMTGVRPGQRLMVIGAAGGVGSFAVQIARARGARVTAVCSPSTMDFVRRLGAETVIDYTREEVDRDGPVHDAILSTGGNRRLSLLRRALTPRGTLVIVGAEGVGSALLGGFSRQLLAPLAAPLSRQRLRGLVSTERAADLDELRTLIDSGQVAPVVDRAYPLDQAADAMRHLTEGHPAGKVALTVAESGPQSA